MHDGEGWRALCILLVVAILFIVVQWNKSEKNRIKLYEELQEKEEIIRTYEDKIDELKTELFYLEEAYGDL